MKINTTISPTFLWSLSLTVLLCLVVFTEYYRSSQYCQSLKIDVKEELKADGSKESIYFIEKENVKDIVEYKGREPVEGFKLINIDVANVENRVKKDKFVKDVEVFKTMRGELEVQVTQRRPIARFIREDSSFYISNQGLFLPLSNRYSARVILISERGKSPYFLDGELKNTADSSLYQLLTMIDKDDFFNKVVSEIILHEDGDIWIRPQVSKQMIVWGLPVDTEPKYKKLKKMYQEILPSKGWNRYKSINLSFRDQIICE